jgi:hypothetical protein
MKMKINEFMMKSGARWKTESGEHDALTERLGIIDNTANISSSPMKECCSRRYFSTPDNTHMSSHSNAESLVQGHPTESCMPSPTPGFQSADTMASESHQDVSAGTLDTPIYLRVIPIINL